MWRIWSLRVYLLCLVSLVSSDSARAAGEDPRAQVKVEVLFRPLQCAPKSKRGDLMNVHYDGYLEEDGTQFYCSRSLGHPQWLVLGVGQVIRGLDVGMEDMCVGEKRKITIPPDLAFGEKGKAPVPPNATVVFEVEAFAVSRGPRSVEAFGDMDQDNDKRLTKAEIKKYLTQQYEKNGESHDESHYEKIMADIFQKNDRDKDGLISANEYNIYSHDEL